MNTTIDGIASRDLVFGPGPGLPGQVFAAEILTRPVVLRRSGDTLEVHVDRRGVTHAVYTTEGKDRLCGERLRGERLGLAVRLDEDIHAFMMEAGDGSWLEIPTRDIPLRWASGGVLPVVEWRGGAWSPFFFRDIPPVGWNIAVGSSETEAELNRPVSFGLREFVEETIVLPRPPQAGVEIEAKSFPYIMTDDGAEIDRALESVNRHLAIRSREDGLTLPGFPPGDVPVERAIDTNLVPTGTRLYIRDEDGEVEISNVLVCFNLLELGIEVVSVARFELEDDDYLLDGEMITPVGGAVELVRMPIAMISHAYLEAAFGGQHTGLEYGNPPLAIYDAAADVWKQVRASRPSVKPHRPPILGEIAVFGWDVARRMKLGAGRSLDDHRWKTDPMRTRHRKWCKSFARYFETDEAVGTPHEVFPFFTAVSAKTMTYYFSQTEGKTRS
jgi:hypothetical protein